MDWNAVWTAVGAIATAVGAFAIGFAALQLRFEAWLKAQEVFTEDGFVSARTAVFQHFDDVHQPWPKDDDNAKKVCRKMDELARLESFVTLPRRRILRVWGNPIAKAWLLLKPTVTRECEVAHWDKKWKAFTVLGKEAVRGNQSLSEFRENVLQNHDNRNAAQQGDVL